MVRPWNPPWVATSLARPVSRAILNAVSFASAPELQNSTRPWPVAPARSSSRSASFRPSSCT